jgi:hypothetical protein
LNARITSALGEAPDLVAKENLLLTKREIHAPHCRRGTVRGQAQSPKHGCLAAGNG